MDLGKTDFAPIREHRVVMKKSIVIALFLIVTTLGLFQNRGNVGVSHDI